MTERPMTSREVAVEIVQRFCREAHPKPAQSFPTMVGVVTKLLRAGWSPSQLMAALPECWNVSVGALTVTLNKHKQERQASGGREVISSAEGDAVVAVSDAADAAIRLTVEKIPADSIPEAVFDAFEALGRALDALEPLRGRITVARYEREAKAARAHQ